MHDKTPFQKQPGIPNAAQGAKKNVSRQAFPLRLLALDMQQSLYQDPKDKV